jgi:hypothetical protein
LLVATTVHGADVYVYVIGVVPTPAVLGEKEPVAGSKIPVPVQVPPVVLAVSVVFNEFKQNGVACVMFTAGAPTTVTVV